MPPFAYQSALNAFEANVLKNTTEYLRRLDVYSIQRGVSNHDMHSCTGAHHPKTFAKHSGHLSKVWVDEQVIFFLSRLLGASFSKHTNYLV